MTTTGFSESDLSRNGKAHQNATQNRSVGMPLVSGDFDQMVENPFTQMSSNPAKSAKQARFMRGCAHGASMRKKCPSESVAREFMHT